MTQVNKLEPHIEIADIFRSHAYKLSALSKEQRKAVNNIIKCRTSALGGHVLKCDNQNCSHMEISYNSCRDRHCPKCQTLLKERWILDRQKELLPVQYFHIVFTIPKMLAPIILENKTIGYNLLFQAISSTLKEVALNPRNLDAHIGFIAVLHSWDQTLLFHPHIHCILPGGGIAKDGETWINAAKDYFLPVKVLSLVFKGKFLSTLESLHKKQKLSFHGKNVSPLKSPDNFKQLLVNSASHDWVVYSKPPLAGPKAVIKYLGRYTHRIAISNYRIKKFIDGKVTFSYRNRKHGNALKTMTLDVVPFMRRFLLHILPKGFVKIRYLGILCNAHKSAKLKIAKISLSVSESDVSIKHPKNWIELMIQITGLDPTICPACRFGHLLLLHSLPPSMIPP